MSEINQISIVDLLDNTIENEELKRSKERLYNPLRPSSSGKCSKALWYELQEFRGNEETTLDIHSPSVVRLLDYGHWTEEHLIKMFEKLYDQFNIKIKYKQQVVDVLKLNDGSIIEGSVDFALESDNRDVKILGDAKSAKDAFSKAYKTRWDENSAKWANMRSFKQISPTCFYAEDALALVDEFGDDFKTNNICQLNLYLGSRFFQDRNYQYGSLFYYVKNDSRLFELRFKYSPKLKELIEEKFNKINNTSDAKYVKKEYTLGSIRCAFCSHKDKCWNENALKMYFKTLPKTKFPTDIARLSNNEELIKQFKDYENLIDNDKIKSKIESNIIKKLQEEKIRKIKLDNGHIYEIKFLKSPREHFELRRSKIK